jgi:RNA polymerase sigma-70 factor (ECF subfamily)
VRPVPIPPEDRTVIEAVINGDEVAFAELTRKHRRELHVHCYRMLASFEDAEDLVQDTFLRAWQRRATFEGRGSIRSWLYRIATNGCLDFLEKNKRRAMPDAEAGHAPGSRPAEVPWLQPFPDRLLAEAAPASSEPDAKLLARESIELAYIVALQFLPPRQRASLILCDVLDWSAQEAATLLETTTPAVNGALRRARATLRERHHSPRTRTPTEGERELLQQVVAATERGDVDALARLLHDDVRFSMPPEPGVAVGRQAVVDAWVSSGFGSPPYDDFKCVLTGANGGPAVVSYHRGPGDGEYRPLAIDVLRLQDGLVAEITTFGIHGLLDAFALPPTLR